MIFATLNYDGNYDSQHRQLHRTLSMKFEDVQEGLQCDSWIRIRKNDEEVTVDSFTSMKHEVKARDKHSQLVNEVIDTLKASYDVTVHTPPIVELHE